MPASAIDSYSATAPWSGFGTKVALSIERCATPEISVVGGKLKFTCETEGVKFVPTVTFQNVQGSSDEQANDEMVLAGKVICRVSVYATQEGYDDSEVATKDVEVNFGLKGDVNGDGAVSPADAIESLYIFFGVDQSSAPKKAEPQ